MIGTHLFNNTRNIRNGIGYEQPMIENTLLCITFGNSCHSKKNCPKYITTVENKTRETYRTFQRNMYTHTKLIFPNGLIEILSILLNKTRTQVDLGS